MILYIVGAVLLLGLLGVLYIYNTIIKLKVRVEEAWSGMDIQLKRRYDLIPNIVSLVDAYAKEEKSILTAVTQLRMAALQDRSVATQARLDAEITPKLQQINVTVEKYPEIKSSENFVKLQNQFVEIEEHIAYSRKYYNGTVRNYNIAINSFPNTVLAQLLHLKPAVFFEADEAARNDISIK